MTVGGASIPLSMIYAGLVESGFIGIVLSGGNISELRPSDTVAVTNQSVDIGTAEEEEDEPEPQSESEEA